MSDLRKAAQQALEALENDAMQRTYAGGVRIANAAIALRAALAEPEQEPVAWMDREGDVYKELPTPNWCPPHTPLYAHPPTPRRPLTDEELEPLCDAVNSYDITNYDLVKFARAIERAHGITGETK